MIEDEKPLRQLASWNSSYLGKVGNIVTCRRQIQNDEAVVAK